MRRLMLAMGLGLWAAVSAQAQSLGKPKEFYFDEDKYAAPISVASGEGEALAAALVKIRDRRDRRAIEATAQLAHLAFGDGRIDLGKGLYAQAQASGRPDTGIGRAVTWNFGWDLYRSGDYEAALGQWSLIANSALGGPSWLPPTLALVLWKLDRREEAVAWYGAAMRTEPSVWGDAARFASLLPDWKAEDREVLGQVLAAWQKTPPVWP